MRHASSVMYFIAAAAIVIIVGGLVGWYVFMKQHIDAVETGVAGRGFQSTPAFGNAAQGSFGAGISEFLRDSASSTSRESARAAPRLWEVSKRPTAGFGFSASSTELLFADSATGNILSAQVESSEITRMTTTLYPKIYEARFGSSGVLLRSADNDSIVTFSGVFATSTSATHTDLSGLFGVSLAEDIRDVRVAPKDLLVYLMPDESGGSMIIQSKWNGSGEKKIFSSTFLAWNLDVLSDGTIVLVQKTIDRVPGYAFTLVSGALVPLETEIPGLTVRARAGGARLYGSSNGTLALYARTAGDTDATLLGIKTTADKCVWAPGNALIAYCAVPQNILRASFLSDYYQGTAHSIDAWYRVDASTGRVEVLYSPEPGLALDVEEPTIDAGGSYIAFRNAADRSLWMLRVAP